MLFIQGTRDAFGKLDLLQDVVQEIGERATLHLIEEGDHSFKVPKRVGRTEGEITQEILDTLTRWLRTLGEER
jgi:predicted alpha/beta-hydrolase family hydrolase